MTIPPDQPPRPAPMPTMTIRLGMGWLGFWLAEGMVCAAIVLRSAIAPVAMPAGADATPVSGPAESARPDLAKPTGEVAKQTRAFFAAVARSYDRVADEVEAGSLAALREEAGEFRRLAR
jgi:hypothetical protein